MAKRVNVRITEEVDEKVKVWSNKLGISQSQLMGMAIQAGLDTIIRAVAPAETFSAGQWAEIVAAYEKKKEEKGGD